MWFYLALFATLSYGIQNFFFKIAEEKKCDKEITILTFFLTVGITALALFLLNQKPIQNIEFIILIGLTQATFALFAYVLRLEAFDRIPAVTVYPLLGLSAFFAALLGIIFLGENVGFFQVIGIILSLTAIIILIEELHFHLKKGILIALLSALLMSVSSILVKIASEQVNLLFFIAISSLYASLPLYLLEKKRTNSVGCKKSAVKMGFFLGITNFLAFYSLLRALSIAEASQVYPVKGTSLVISIILAEAIYKEKLTKSRIISATLALTAIILLGMSS